MREDKFFGAYEDGDVAFYDSIMKALTETLSVAVEIPDRLNTINTMLKVDAMKKKNAIEREKDTSEDDSALEEEMRKLKERNYSGLEVDEDDDFEVEDDSE